MQSITARLLSVMQLLPFAARCVHLLLAKWRDDRYAVCGADSRIPPLQAVMFSAEKDHVWVSQWIVSVDQIKYHHTVSLYVEGFARVESHAVCLRTNAH